MDCTVPTTTPATASAPRSVSPTTLAAAFATVPDPRRQASVRYSLAAILSLTVAAVLCAHTSVLAIAEWGARQGDDLLIDLGFADGCTPCQSTLHRLFRHLDSHALSVSLQSAFTLLAAADPTTPGGQGVAIDGKAQRGRLQFETTGSPVHALVAYCHECDLVLAQEPIGHGQTKAEAELTVAPRLIDRVAWRGRVLTGDALFCQRTLCAQVLAADGDYLVLVKANQPKLYDAIRLLFDPTLAMADRREVRTIDQGHGRTAERRHLIASTDLVGYLEWPGHAQVFRVERTWYEHGEHKRQVRYGITSLDPASGTPQRLLALKRGHWLIENHAHRSKDVNLGEDASLVHLGQGPTVFAMLRDAAINLLRATGCRTVASRLRDNGQCPAAAVALLHFALSTRA